MHSLHGFSAQLLSVKISTMVKLTNYHHSMEIYLFKFSVYDVNSSVATCVFVFFGEFPVHSCQSIFFLYLAFSFSFSRSPHARRLSFKSAFGKLFPFFRCYTSRFLSYSVRNYFACFYSSSEN